MNTAIEDQLIEAKIDQIKSTRNHEFSVFTPGDSEVSQALEGGKMKLTSTAEDRAVIYDTETGEPREVLVNMLAKTLKKRRNGKPAFSHEPVKEFKYGSVPCWFNPASPKYAEISKIPGLESFECASANLASEFDAELHVKHRHDRRYLRVKDYEERMERERNNDRQERQIAAMLAMAGGSKAAVHACDIDDCPRFFDSEQGLKVHKGRDHSKD